jgi:5-(carboxyamino)imidazole ribonucleotide mutase
MARSKPVVGLIMGSQSDWTTMRHAAVTLEALGVPHESAASRGLQVIIAGAGGAAHLPGMVASLTTLPVFGVPVESQSLKGMDSLLSIVQMPGGIPVGTVAIGKPGAINAALLAASVIGLQNQKVAKALQAWRERQTKAVAEVPSDEAK